MTAPTSGPGWFIPSSVPRPGDVQCPGLATLYLPACAPRCNNGKGRTCGECAALRASGAQLDLFGRGAA